jgi:hypothetical protein
MFIEKTAEEIAAMNPKEMAAYHKEREDHLNEERKKLIAEKADKKEIDRIDEKLKELSEKDSEDIEKALKRIEELEKANEKLTETVEKQGLKMNETDKKETDIKGEKYAVQLAKGLNALLNSEEFETYMKHDFRGSTGTYSEKSVVDVTNDHTGTVLLSDIRDRVRSDDDTFLRHMYDIIPQETTDGTQIVFPQVYDWTDAWIGNATMLGENEEITDVQVKTKEVTATIKRIGQSLTLSKRYIKTNSLSWVQSYVLHRLPNQILTKLDFQQLFGNGTGNNLTGLATQAQNFDLTPNTYAAAAFSSVADHGSIHGDNYVKVTFAADHNIKNGDNLTIANSTNYNGTYNDVITVSETEVLIESAYTAEATAAWTGSSSSSWYQSVDNAQEFDVLTAAISTMQARGFEINGVVLNPNEVGKISLIKETTAGYIGVTRDAAGNLNINGVPIITLQAIPAGHFLIGNFREVATAEYTPLQVSASESTDEKKKNQVVFIAEMELIYPIYNPYAFMYDNFTDAKSELETP